MTHTKYESYMTHLQDLVVFLFYNQTQSSTKWNHHSNFGRWIICSNFATHLYSDSQKTTPDSQPRRTELYWKFQSGLAVSPWADVAVCDFIQLLSIYLSHNVNSDVEQWWVEINSPVPQHTHYIVSNTHTHTHNLNDTEIHMRKHTRCGMSLFIQLGQDQRTVLVPFPIWCVKSGRKSKPFPSFWPLWVVVPWGSRGETGSKVSLSLESLGSVWGSTYCQK